MKWLAFLLLGCLALLWLAVDQRQALFYQVARLSGGEPPALLDPAPELPGTRWHDDYYTVDEIAPNTWAIGEPRYYQQNYNYLIVGEARALLFDAGPGVRDIRPVVASLTDLPVVFLPSHFHYDHVGNGIRFEQRAVVDLPELRARVRDGELAFTELEHLGPVEGFPVPSWRVDHWWAPGAAVDLGGRSVTVLHTPGHSRESISLLDEQNELLLSGDYLYEGPLYAFLPGSSLRDYLATARALVRHTAGDVRFYGAHRTTPPGPPVLSSVDLADLEQALLRLKDGQLQGTGVWPVTYVINDRVSLLADPGMLQDWE
jgi:glyoxylase-like metal-dependent hydrolase (beta-lactamase superfamily II)